MNSFETHLKALKAEKRQELRQAREAMSEEQYQRRNVALNAFLMKYFTTLGPLRDIHVFLPIAVRREPDITPTLRWLEQNTLATFYTSVLEGDKMSSVEYNLDDELVLGRFGIPIPKDAKPLPDEPPLDAILVPVIGFDDQCNRLGYGYGHYDRWLTQHPHALKIGVAFEVGHAHFIPVEETDQPLDVIVTDNERGLVINPQR